MEKYSDYLSAMVSGIVSNPEDVRIDTTQDEMGILCTLFVNQKDMGLVIGKGGATVQMIRGLLHIFGVKHNARVSLKVFDPREAGRQY